MEEALELHACRPGTDSEVLLQLRFPLIDEAHFEALGAVVLAGCGRARDLGDEPVEQLVDLPSHGPQARDVVQGPGGPPHPTNGLLVLAVASGLLGVLEDQAAKAS